MSWLVGLVLFVAALVVVAALRRRAEGAQQRAGIRVRGGWGAPGGKAPAVPPSFDREDEDGGRDRRDTS